MQECSELSGLDQVPLDLIEHMDLEKGSGPTSFVAFFVIIHSAEDLSVNWELRESSRYQQKQGQKERKESKDRNLKQGGSKILEGQTNKLTALPMDQSIICS